MSTHTRRKRSPPGQHNIAGKRHGNVNTQAQHGVVPGRRADRVDQPFPNKAVSHRRPLNPRTQDSLNLYDFEKITITKQPRGPLSPQGHHSNDISQTTASRHPREDSPRGEVQLAKAIHAKELMLQEKLRRVEEKIRQKIQRDSVEAGDDDQKNEEEWYDRGQAERGKAQAKNRLSEQQWREPVRGREMVTQEKRQEDVKQLRRRHDQRNEDRMKNKYGEEGARWKREEIEVAQSPQLQRKECKGTQEITEKSRWENVNEHTRRKGEDEKDSGIRGQSHTTSMGNKGWAREKKYRERTYKEMYGSDDERDMPQMSQQKTSHRAAKDAGGKLSEQPLIPSVSSPSHSGRPEQRTLRLIDGTHTSLQLLPCRVCNRKFASERLETHVRICKKVKQSKRQVFNSYVNRNKGSAVEQFWKTHGRPKTPEVLIKKDVRQNHKANTRNLQEGRHQAGTSQPKRTK